MIRLSKVVLINWMYFQKTTINLEGNTAIVGVNGTGKSTIIDAIQMLLLGNRASRFNANANAEKRTLESYVRGAVKVDDKPFLRSGDVISYLAMEIILNGTKHVFGMNLDYKFNLSKLSDPKYFYVKDLDLSEDIFISNNYPKTYDVVSKELKANYEFNSFATLTYYQYKLKDILGLKDEKAYFKTLSRAVGIKNITDCNTFMNEFVLDDNPIDVSSIKNNIIEMEKVSKTIENEEKKLKALTAITDLGIELEGNIKTEKICNTKQNIAKSIIFNNDVKRIKAENENLQSNITEETNKKNLFENNKNDLIDVRNSLIKSLDNISPNLSNLKEELFKKQKEYENAQVTLNTFRTMCINELPKLSILSRFKNKNIDEFYLYIEKDEFTTETIRRQFYKFREESIELVEAYKKEAYSINVEGTKLKNELIEIDKIITSLKNNQRTYGKALIDFLNYIKAGLKEKFNQDVEVNFLCEYLDIKDESWRNAIEGYLGRQKFYLVVPNEFYKEAIRLYHEKKDFYQTKIIDGTKLPELEFDEGTLGEFIEASNSIALNYARYLLNRVHCVKNIKDLNLYDVAITKDCMLYQGYTIGRINPRLSNEQYIGQEGIKNQLMMRLEQKNKLENEYKEKIGKYQKINGNIKVLEDEIKFTNRMIENNSYFESIDKSFNLFDSVNKLVETISFYENNPQYIEINAKLQEVEKEISSINNLITKSEDTLISLKASLKSNEKSIADLNTKIEEINKFIEIIDENIVHLANKELEGVSVTKTYIDKLTSEIKILDNQNNKKQSDLENLMKNARDSFNINVEANYEALNRFKEEKSKINQDVFKYQSKLVEIKKKNRNLFFSQFLTKLYKSVNEARKTIDNLNHSLSIFDFGKDYYKIKLSITQNKDFETIYNYAKEYNSDESDRGLFIDYEREDRDRNKIMDLLNQYMFSDNPVLQNSIVDYRKYLYFDVEAHTPNGVKKLNEVMKTQSGGEVQVPFYILSGVAFQQTLDYKRNKDALGIVLYDEAFDKMDSQRIQSMLQFYRDKLNLQIVLATPGKLDSLVDNIETVVAVIRDGETAIVSDISHEI